MKMKKFSMILAIDVKNGLWKDNDLAWRLPKDMKHFQKITTQTVDPEKCNAVIMGRKTWESIPQKYRPLPGRVNCILSRKAQTDITGAVVYRDFGLCLEELSQQENIENIFVIGWAQIYNSLLSHEALEKIYLTQVESDFRCDVFFDGIPTDFQLKTISSAQQEWDIEYYFTEYIKKGI